MVRFEELRPKAADFFGPTVAEPPSSPDDGSSTNDTATAAPTGTPHPPGNALPPSTLPPRFPTGPLNLNPDGTPINYRKSHCGPNAEYWQRADAEEFQRLLQTGTLRPIMYTDIPADNVVTYVNPVCSEKVNDDGSVKFRTRLTIGGDRINYPFDKSAETADLEAVKLLLNCMISEDANWSTMDLTDFYLGTDLPHPEYLRIPEAIIPCRY
jgi:hypothetical protein